MRIHKKIVDRVDKLKRGKVWCHSCGREREVESEKCLAEGWPSCCGQTMSIDSPSERGPNRELPRYRSRY